MTSVVGRLVAVLSMVLGAGAPAFAQADPPKQPETVPSVSETVVVTANRLEQRVKDVPVTVIVLTRQDILRSTAQSVDELLSQIPGFSLLRQGSSHASHPSVRSASMRGLGGSNNSRTLVLLDGVPMNEPFAGVVYWTRVPLESIERVEVVKSAAAGVWGNLAMGGVINIITKSPGAGQPVVALTAEGGNQQTGHVNAAVSGTHGPFRAIITANHFRTDGYSTIREDQRGPVDIAVNDLNSSVDGKLEYAPSPTAVWSVGGSFYDEDQNAGTPLYLVHIGAGYLRASGDFVTPANHHWQFVSFLSRQRSTNQTSTVAPDRRSETLAGNQFDVPATSVGTSLQWSRPMSAEHLLSAGADLQWIDARVNENFNFVSGQLTRLRESGGRQSLSGVYLQDIYQITQRWRLVSAARVDGWQSFDGTRRETDIQSTTVLRDETYSDRSRWTFNPSLGVVHQTRSWLTLRASASRAFRAPTPGELYRPFRAPGNVITESNASLSPERLTGAEGGFEVVLARGFRARLDGFWGRLQDPVSTVTIQEAGPRAQTIAPCGVVAANGICRQRQNLGRLLTRGIDSEIEYRFGHGWSAAVSYLFNRSTVVDAPGQPALVGVFNRHSPLHQVVAAATYDNSRLAVISIQGRYVGSRFEDDLNTLPIGEFFVADVHASRKVSSKVEAFVSVQNLFDRTYEITKPGSGLVGVGMPRLINAGLRAHF